MNRAARRRNRNEAPPVSRQVTVGPRQPAVTSTANGVRIRHTELFSAVEGDGVVRMLTVTPTNGQMFRWLSTMATLYETYTINKMQVHYKTCQATTAAGSVYMAFDYDPLDDAPVDRVELMTYAGSKRCAIWQNCECPLNTQALRENRYYTASIDNVTDQIRFTSAASFVYLVQGPANEEAGEFYVEYDITLQTPQSRDKALPIIALSRPTLALPSADWFTVPAGQRSFEAAAGMRQYNWPTGFRVDTNVSGTYLVNFSAELNANTETFPTMDGHNGVTFERIFASSNTVKNRNAMYRVYFPATAKPLARRLDSDPYLSITGGNGTLDLYTHTADFRSTQNLVRIPITTTILFSY